METKNKISKNKMIEYEIHALREVTSSEILSEHILPAKAAKIQCFAQQCRINTFDMIRKRGNGHWGGSASVTEILTTFYYHVMNIDPANPKWEDRDRLILSKGHAAPILYTLLAKRGYFEVSELSTFRQLNSRLQGHPCMNKTPGVEMSTGALGHGLSIGLGMALASRILKKKYWTFIIVGDGCLNEGQSWEAIMATAKFSPERLVILVDYNKVDGPSDEIMPLDPLPEKFKAFNLNVADRIYNGHSVTEIMESWEWMQKNQNNPSVVIYKTHKGKGVSFMEDQSKWHGAPIDDASYELGRAELLSQLQNLQV
jgi:transketolase